MKTEGTSSLERATRITQGAEIITAQARCTFAEAIALMNARAMSCHSSLELVAIAVLVGDIRFD